MKNNYILLFALIFSLQIYETNSDNYLAYLDEIASSNIAVIVVDMYASDQYVVPGFTSTSNYISEIVTKVSDSNGLVVCVTEHSPKGERKICPHNVIPQKIQEKEKNRRFLTIDKTHYSAFKETKLNEILIKNGITSILVVGAYTDMCIKDTVIDALYNQFNVTLFFGAVTTTPGIFSKPVDMTRYRRTLFHETNDFYKLAKSLSQFVSNESLKIICAPSRFAGKRDRDDPDSAFNFHQIQRVIFN